MSPSVEQILSAVDENLRQWRSELDGLTAKIADEEAFRRRLMGYAPQSSSGVVLPLSLGAQTRIAETAEQLTARVDFSKRARIFQLYDQMLEALGPMTARQILEHLDSMGQKELVTGPDFNARSSTLSSIMSRKTSPYQSDREKGGYVRKNEKPAQDGNPERAEQHAHLS